MVRNYFWNATNWTVVWNKQQYFCNKKFLLRNPCQTRTLIQDCIQKPILPQWNLDQPQWNVARAVVHQVRLGAVCTASIYFVWNMFSFNTIYLILPVEWRVSSICSQYLLLNLLRNYEHNWYCNCLQPRYTWNNEIMPLCRCFTLCRIVSSYVCIRLYGPWDQCRWTSVW